jgi:hypothetical protein
MNNLIVRLKLNSRKLPYLAGSYTLDLSLKTK